MSLGTYDDAGSFYRPGDACCGVCGVFAHPDTVSHVDGLVVCVDCAELGAAKRSLAVLADGDYKAPRLLLAVILEAVALTARKPAHRASRAA